ncbi:MAG TPA: VOC family protein [Gaiellaceae bacterium]|jgi:predicted enzyme related to lactoylglutathione lyase|nr:VOC family protein [Gaiellaceae bacterium]
MAGEVVHIEFPSEDADRAQAFWSGLFGWEFGGAMEGMDYRMAQGGPGWGVAVFPAPERSGYPNYYLDTPDIDASSTKVRELGGEADAKSPVPGHGWFAACTDSEGNHFHLWQGDPSAGS